VRVRWRNASRVPSSSRAITIRAADVVVLALDYAHARQLVTDLHAALRGKVLVDPTTPWDAEIPATSAAEELALLAPSDTAIVGAWKTTYAAELDAARPDEPHDTFVCGDDSRAKARVRALVGATGFRALDAGALSQARVLEGMCRMMGPMGKTLGAAPGAVPAWRFVSR
jgi:predicted dinucleotide-binding enzyme